MGDSLPRSEQTISKTADADKSFLPTIRAIAAAQARRDADRAEFAALLENIAARP